MNGRPEKKLETGGRGAGVERLLLMKEQHLAKQPAEADVKSKSNVGNKKRSTFLFRINCNKKI